MEKIADKIAEAVEGQGYECVHVGLKTDSARPRLQILIDSLGGVSIDDCERVSRAVGRLLDEMDAGTGSYDLEVSSPGVERPLFTREDYVRFQGREARLHLKTPLSGRRNMTGRIEDVDEEGVTLALSLEQSLGPDRERVPFDAIKAGNLVFRASEPQPERRRGRGGKRAAGKHREEEL